MFFPMNVLSTPCKTRTFSMRLPAVTHKGKFYHSERLTITVPASRKVNMVLEMTTGKITTRWADAEYDSRYAVIKEV